MQDFEFTLSDDFFEQSGEIILDEAPAILSPPPGVSVEPKPIRRRRPRTQNPAQSRKRSRVQVYVSLYSISCTYPCGPSSYPAVGPAEVIEFKQELASHTASASTPLQHNDPPRSESVTSLDGNSSFFIPVTPTQKTVVGSTSSTPTVPVTPPHPPSVTYNFMNNELVLSKTRTWSMVHDPVT